jgi:transketolase
MLTPGDSVDPLAIDTIRTLAGWDRYVGSTDARIAMVSFGASAPFKDLFQDFGFTTEHAIAVAKEQIEQHKEIRREPADSVA